MRGPDLIALVVLPVLFMTIAFVIWVLANAWQRRLRLKLTTEFNGKLLERIGSVKDFNDFLQTAGGAKFMDSLTIERSSSRPQDSILRALQIGIVLVMLGTGFLLLNWYFSARYTQDTEVLAVVGVVAASLGLGFLISAGASYRVARMLGVLDPNGRHASVHDAV